MNLRKEILSVEIQLAFLPVEDKLPKYNINDNIGFIELNFLQWGSRLFSPERHFTQ